MPYRITIQDETGKDIGGLIQFSTVDGDNLGELVVPIGGQELPAGAVDLADYFKVSHQGYGWITVGKDSIGSDTVFTLYRQTSPVMYAVIGAVGLFGLWALIKK